MLKQLALSIPPIRRLWNDRLALIEERDNLARERTWLTAQRNRLIGQVSELTKPAPKKEPPVPEPNEDSPTKTITLGGKEVVICGSPKDAYFKQLNGKAFDGSFLGRIVRERLSTDATVFDVGANIGVTTALFAQHVGNGHVVSFEPSPVAFRYLEATIGANHFVNARPLNVALGAAAGKLPFSDNTQSATASHLNFEGSLGEASHTVLVERLDAIAAQYAPDRLDFIKIDVEGYEKGVVEGGMATIKARQPLVLLEFNTFTLLAYGNENPRAFLEYLQGIFSDIQYLINGEVKHANTKNETLHFIHANLISHHSVSDLLCIP